MRPTPCASPCPEEGLVEGWANILATELVTAVKYSITHSPSAKSSSHQYDRPQLEYSLTDGSGPMRHAHNNYIYMHKYGLYNTTAILIKGFFRFCPMA